MYWDKKYEKNQQIWGNEPSELAVITTNIIIEHFPNRKSLDIIDIGCGYGRDSVFLGKHIDCNVIGIDMSQKGIEIANGSLTSEQNISFKCCDFTDIRMKKFDIVFASNLYQVLRFEEREKFRNTISNLMKPQGWLFMNSLSVNDPEEYGKGERCLEDPHSFQKEKFLHFCTKDELERDFCFLDIRELYEHEYIELRSEGKNHHHISWILIGTARHIT